MLQVVTRLLDATLLTVEMVPITRVWPQLMLAINQSLHSAKARVFS